MKLLAPIILATGALASFDNNDPSVIRITNGHAQHHAKSFDSAHNHKKSKSSKSHSKTVGSDGSWSTSSHSSFSSSSFSDGEDAANAPSKSVNIAGFKNIHAVSNEHDGRVDTVAQISKHGSKTTTIVKDCGADEEAQVSFGRSNGRSISRYNDFCNVKFKNDRLSCDGFKTIGNNYVFKRGGAVVNTQVAGLVSYKQLCPAQCGVCKPVTTTVERTNSQAVVRTCSFSENYEPVNMVNSYGLTEFAYNDFCNNKFVNDGSLCNGKMALKANQSFNRGFSVLKSHSSGMFQFKDLCPMKCGVCKSQF